MADFTSARSSAEFDEPESDYRTVEPWAVGGLLLGFLSAAALAGGLLWLVAGAALAVNLVALIRLRRNPTRTGRPAALLGVALSVAFGMAPAAQMGTSWFLLSRQAREVSDQFFEFLREDSPEKAMMLRFAPDQRQPFNDLLWTYFKHDAEARENMRAFVKHPVVRTLLALGKQADVRFYKTSSVATEGTRGMVSYFYTVTYPDKHAAHGKKTFFINVLLERKPTTKPGINPWRVVELTGDVDPR